MMAELLANWIGRWCNDGSEWAWRSNGDGAVARCSALLWRGRERAGCEGEMERAAEVHTLSLHAGMTGRANIGVLPPRGGYGLWPVGHCRARPHDSDAAIDD